MPYLFSWVHEFSHTFTTLFIDEIDFLGIEVYYPYGGVTHAQQDYLILNDEIIEHCWLHFSGSVGSIIAALSLNRILYHTKKINFSVFLPLFITTTLWIFYEFYYWFNGINYYLKGINAPHDAYRFLFLYLQIDDPLIPIDPLILGI